MYYEDQTVKSTAMTTPFRDSENVILLGKNVCWSVIFYLTALSLTLQISIEIWYAVDHISL